MILFSGWSCSRERESGACRPLLVFTVVVVITVQRQQGDPTGPRDLLPKHGECRKEKNGAHEVGCPSCVWGQVWRAFQWWILKCCKIVEGDSWGHPGPCLMLGGLFRPPSHTPSHHFPLFFIDSPLDIFQTKHQTGDFSSSSANAWSLLLHLFELSFVGGGGRRRGGYLYVYLFVSVLLSFQNCCPDFLGGTNSPNLLHSHGGGREVPYAES